MLAWSRGENEISHERSFTRSAPAAALCELGLMDVHSAAQIVPPIIRRQQPRRVCVEGHMSTLEELGTEIVARPVPVFLPPAWLHCNLDQKEGAKMPENRIKVAPDTVAYADGENHKLVVEFAIPGAPTDTIDVKILEDSVHLTAPARDIEYVSALALGWPVKPDKAEATYEHGLLRIEVPFKDPMEDAVKVAIKAGGAETKTKKIEA